MNPGLLRALYGTSGGSVIVPPFFKEAGLVGRAAEKFDVISSMFTLHYFFADPTTRDGFLNNIAENLKVGGFFIGCCFDGETVYNSLSKLALGGVLTGKEGDAEVWSIEKQYDVLPDELALPDTEAGLGRKIKVNFITIGEGHEEYLVNFEHLKKQLAGMGVDVLTPDELTSLGLSESTGLFKKIYRESFRMPPKLREFSFLNRWFIFRRRSYGPLSEALAGPEGEPVEIVLPILPASVASAGAGTRGRGGATRGRGRGGTRGGRGGL
jgi:hypothetical protein